MYPLPIPLCIPISACALYAVVMVFLYTQKENEIGQLVGRMTANTRTGSDGDSGVLITVDENEVFSTESTANGDTTRGFVATPSSYEDNLNDCMDEDEDGATEEGVATEAV